MVFMLFALVVWSYKPVLPAMLHIELCRIKDVYDTNFILFVIDKNVPETHIEHDRIVQMFISCKLYF